MGIQVKWLELPALPNSPIATAHRTTPLVRADGRTIAAGADERTSRRKVALMGAPRSVTALRMKNASSRLTRNDAIQHIATIPMCAGFILRRSAMTAVTASAVAVSHGVRMAIGSFHNGCQSAMLRAGR